MPISRWARDEFIRITPLSLPARPVPDPSPTLQVGEGRPLPSRAPATWSFRPGLGAGRYSVRRESAGAEERVDGVGGDPVAEGAGVDVVA